MTGAGMAFYELCVSVHVLAAAVWIGSLAFFALVVVPVLRRRTDAEGSRVLLRAFAARFRILGWVTLAVLVGTGIGNLRFHEIGWSVLREPTFWTSGFGRALAYKLSLVMTVIGAVVIHDVLAKAGRSRGRVDAWSGRLILGLSVAILYFAIALVRGLP